ncbi:MULTISPECIES: hypothetical protein [unclassified Amycolatopsis]|uniref:hypothetical protein n=1 Tax=unclassified Amycolatopsis TaxID=2618356 RepID=UPI002875C74F|nr:MULTISPECIES: hypothetical protein [unclassified Amycolatopsis]MDS0140393.1 hypothetical protein [Amycolatopsis sp. 505]MDS0149002.1 hypothetical protein [Amycolatopsis sp. CM201R]
MTGYGRDRERRRRTRTLLGVGYLVALTAVLGLKTGWLPAVATPLGVLVLLAVVLRWIMWRDARAERRRRATGQTPSWPAQLPVQAALLLGAKAPGHHARRADEVGELFGRLSLRDGSLHWKPRAGDRNRGVGPVTFDRSWTTEVVPLWGPGDQGCLTLTSSDGPAVDVWIRHPADLRQALAALVR